MKKPRILLYDIETSPNLAYVWGKWQQDVIAYESERELLCFAYQWYGENKIHCMSKEGQSNDKKLVKQLANLLEEADISIAHNGDEFDRKIVKARMLYWNMKPLKINCSVDTKKVAKNYFKFNGNGLEDLCKFLGIGNKKRTPGFSMWLGCMNDLSKDWKLMREYNKHDVSLLNKLYKRMLPYIENHPNISRILNPNMKSQDKCPSCLSIKIKRDGIRATLSKVSQMWQCLLCGKNWITSYKKDVK